MWADRIGFAAMAGAAALLAAGAAFAQEDENPHTPGAIPNPGSYQGSMQLQHQQDYQDQQFRQQQQQQYQQPRYGAPSYGQRAAPASRGGAAAVQSDNKPRPAVVPFGKLSPGDEAAFVALNRGDAAGAVRIWRPLAAAGDVNAQYNLAVMYDQGHGVARDPAQAALWYRKAAERGMPAAMVNLGSLMTKRARSPADLVPVYRWFAIAATHSTDREQRANATYNMGLITPLMSPRQIALAQGQARAWRGP
jgi:TPR repeat protein